ncbi:hypothetical protein BASA62_007717 [Batrachochytrium salamandrivorans]|nr:hypothetical protein BASA62_007717 [Batrachochytrium salamandrivorans]
MFSRIKAWGKYVLKIFKPCGISSLSEDSMPADSVIPTTTGSEHMSTATVATMDSMMTPIVAESSDYPGAPAFSVVYQMILIGSIVSLL